ncbi:MAG TPA: hypothetical protein VGU20_19980 [Stellaceae bacterium]|nr:hypothetical protein [Stellaceae bacterium]
MDAAIATLLSWVLLIIVGFAALCWWLLRGALRLTIGRLRSQRLLAWPLSLLAAVRGRFFRYRRQRWCRAQERRRLGARSFD